MKLYSFADSSSCWKVMIALEELGLDYEVESVDVFLGDQFSPSFLSLNPRGSVPVLQTDDLVLTDTTEIMKHLDTVASQAAVKMLPTPGEKVVKFQKMLDDLPLGFLTHGLAFHQTRTKVVRFPYSEEDFFDKARHFILTRADKLAVAAANLGEGQDAAKAELYKQSLEHQKNLEKYVDEASYDAVLRLFDKTLDIFETELSSSRAGCWLGGPFISMADISLGVVLHRLWQLGLDEEFFSGGVRPSLSVFYQTISNRRAFRATTKWDVRRGERWLRQEGPDMVQNAKYGMAAAAVLGGIYIVRKLIKR